jgi:PleD family two-component response regulator
MQTLNKKIKVLVYDDQDVFREGIVEILKSEECFIVRGVLIRLNSLQVLMKTGLMLLLPVFNPKNRILLS